MLRTRELSNNELSELAYLMNKISTLIEKDFCHVEHLVPAALSNEVKKVISKIETEYNERES
jgi:glutathionyl-hydroquinone reductase